MSSRTQFVKLGDVESSRLPISFGVPQGSILGPLLFLIFINDLPNATKFYTKLFADDTFLCAQNENMNVLEEEVNIEIKKVYQWLISNKLTLNISKSKFMIISNKKYSRNEFTVNINDSPLEACDHYKYLGVVIDNKLNWKSHVEYISSKISKACGALAKLRHSLSSKVLVEIYHALVHSYLRYGILTWGTASDATIKPLQTLINRAVRIMTFAPFGRVDLKPIYKELGVLDVKNTFRLETSKFMFKVKNDLLPIEFANHFETADSLSNSTNSYNLRGNSQRKRVTTRLLSSNRSIQVRGENFWEEIPDIIKANNSLNTFKRQTKCMLIESYTS